MEVTVADHAYPGHVGATFDGEDSADERAGVTPTANCRHRSARVQGSQGT
jgi:hypothetical protein